MISYTRNLSRHLNFPKGLLTSTSKFEGLTTQRYVFTSKNKSNMNSECITRSINWTFGSRKRTSLSFSISRKASTTLPNDEYANLNVLPDIVCDLTESIKKYNPNQKADWFPRALEYNLRNGKPHRLLLTVATYRKLIKLIQWQDLTLDNIKLAHILGWCVEMLHVALLTYVDIMDQSSTRRGRLCWHKVENVGLIAINDAIMFEIAIYAVLQKYFGKSECYLELMELFREVSFITANGQCLAMLSSRGHVTSFTMENYKAIAANKTAYFNVYLPFALAMHLAGFRDPQTFQQSKEILLEIGEFCQIQKDYWNCFADFKVTGKHGTDIQDNKCSWLAVVCMQRANDEQRQLMLDCYGKNDPEKIQTVEELYKTLGLPQLYAMYEEESYNKIKSQILQTSNGIPHEVFLKILSKIYQRETQF